MGIGVGRTGVLLGRSLCGLSCLLSLLHRFLGVVIEIGGLDGWDHGVGVEDLTRDLGLS